MLVWLRLCCLCCVGVVVCVVLRCVCFVVVVVCVGVLRCVALRCVLRVGVCGSACVVLLWCVCVV